jgi:DNA topoisomerase-1
MTILVIVESPGKIKKIKSYLGPGYIVMASVGHIRTLGTGNDTIDVNNNFKPNYEIISDKKKVIAGLIKVSKDADEVIIASDGDREGEAIAYHIMDVLKLDDYKRIVFHEITKTAIADALSKPRKIDMNMFNSQQARCILDWLIGFKVSPILKSIPNVMTKSLGAGRVQSVVTRLIVDKEREIEQFLKNDKSSVYHVTCDFKINEHDFKGTYIHNSLVENKLSFPSLGDKITDADIDSYKMIKSQVDTKDQIKIIVINIRADQKFVITNTSCTERFRHPPQPFITSSLQQEASYKLKFQLKRTMTLAQHLYEKGLITYMRTDSPNLANEALFAVKKQILDDPSLGENYYQFRQFKAKGANAQEAHEAIRPTHINVFQLTDYDLTKTDEEKLYQLIWNRTVASQMKSAKYQDQHITLSNSKHVTFEGTNSILIYDGYLKLYKENQDNDDEESSHIKLNDQNLESNNVSWSNIYFKETYGSPPTRFNEPSLVKKLESLGIGRPSTYAYIVTKIQEHKYVRITNIEGIEKQVTTYKLNFNGGGIFSKSSSTQKLGNEKFKMVPTDDGTKVTDYLIEHFSNIMDYKFTAHMEQKLDEIAEGKKIWYDVLKEFYSILKNYFDKLGLTIEQSYYKKQVPTLDNVANENNIDDDKKIITPKQSTQQMIGKHPKFGDIIFMEANFGPVFMIKFGKAQKALFISAGKNKLSDEKILDTAIKYIDYKVNKIKNGTYTGKKKIIKK